MRILHCSKNDAMADDMCLRMLKASLLIVAVVLSKSALGADDPSKAPEPAIRTVDSNAPAAPSSPTRANGVVMLDYQSVKIKGYQPIDLFGFHFLNQFNDWLYLGVGGHAPLVSGEYGGFMAFDATVHVERRLFGNLSASVGTSLGGGGGGKTVEQSKIVSGSGGFLKGYVGLGYRFNEMTMGINYSIVNTSNNSCSLYVGQSSPALSGVHRKNRARRLLQPTFTRWLTARRLLHQYAQLGGDDAHRSADAGFPRGCSRPPFPNRARARTHRHAAAAPPHLVQRLL